MPWSRTCAPTASPGARHGCGKSRRSSLQITPAIPSNIMRVLIIGAGTGGLALAHALRRASIDVAVYERDLAPSDDTGGYRVGISPAGSRALKACVPPDLYDLYVATSARPPRYFN